MKHCATQRNSKIVSSNLGRHFNWSDDFIIGIGFQFFCFELATFKTINQTQKKAEEFQMGVWISALDFQKAFDSIEHSYLWAALEQQGTPKCYIDLLKQLYDGQTGRHLLETQWFRSTVSQRNRPNLLDPHHWRRPTDFWGCNSRWARPDVHCSPRYSWHISTEKINTLGLRSPPRQGREISGNLSIL